MIERAIATAVPFAWVAADSVYGVAAVEGTLRRAGKGYVLGVASNHSVTSWNKVKPIAGTAESVAQGLAPSDWKRLSAGDGVKGPRLHALHMPLRTAQAGSSIRKVHPPFGCLILQTPQSSSGSHAFLGQILISTWTDMPSAADTMISLLLAGFRFAIRERAGSAARRGRNLSRPDVPDLVDGAADSHCGASVCREPIH